MWKKLEIGNRGPLSLRAQDFYRPGLSGPLHLMYLSDFHFHSRSDKVAEQVLELIRTVQVDLLLFGGDYADTRKGLGCFEAMLAAMPTSVAAFAIAGNHDRWVGLEKTAAVFEKNGIQWIEKHSTQLRMGNLNIQIDGNMVTHAVPTHNLLKIHCGHIPRKLERLAPWYQLVFAGHLHGSQFVFWEKDQQLYPGRFFYTWNRLQHRIDDCHYLISRGIGDTLPIRYNCEREGLLVRYLQTAAE